MGLPYKKHNFNLSKMKLIIIFFLLLSSKISEKEADRKVRDLMVFCSENKIKIQIKYEMYNDNQDTLKQVSYKNF
jgi:hypothetical protein